MDKSSSKGITVVIAIVALILVFFAGKQYGQNSAASRVANQGQGQRFQNGNIGARNGRNGGGLAAGEVIAKDDKSITVKIGADGGSRIIFFTASIPITKNVNGTADDIKIGEQVVATGSANPDGSVSAQSIQIRPIMPQNRQVPAQSVTGTPAAASVVPASQQKANF